jgi:sirohydrochlorin ferrochelatase
MAPTLGDAAAGLVGAGATRIDVVPLFLGTGGHLRRDLPPLVDALRAAHPAGRLPPACSDRRARRGGRGDGRRRRRRCGLR